MVAQLHDTGNTSTDWMRMYADDPVTGTSVMYWMDGSTLKGSIAEQVEPLGQRVEVTDPEVWVNEPTSYENQVLNSASDPEWQCTVQGRYQTFMDMPDHCQRKILESFDRGLDEVFGFAHLETYQIRWGTAAEKGSYGSTITTAQQAMQFALSITHKPASGGGSSSADSGYSHQSGPMQWDVQVNAGYDIIADNFTRLDPANAGGDPIFGNYIQDAIDATTAILEGDSACAKWFGENGRLALKAFSKQLLAAPQTRVSGEDYLGIHLSTTTRGPLRYFDANDKQLSSNTTTAYRLFSTVEINSLGPFANPQSRGKIGSQNVRPATLESRIAQILHEVAHLAYKDYKPLIEDDKNDVAKSIANSNIILDEHKCMDAISAYMRSVQPQ